MMNFSVIEHLGNPSQLVITRWDAGDINKSWHVDACCTSMPDCTLGMLVLELALFDNMQGQLHAELGKKGMRSATPAYITPCGPKLAILFVWIGETYHTNARRAASGR